MWPIELYMSMEMFVFTYNTAYPIHLHWGEKIFFFAAFVSLCNSCRWSFTRKLNVILRYKFDCVWCIYMGLGICGQY